MRIDVTERDALVSQALMLSDAAHVARVAWSERVAVAGQHRIPWGYERRAARVAARRASRHAWRRLAEHDRRERAETIAKLRAAPQVGLVPALLATMEGPR